MQIVTCEVNQISYAQIKMRRGEQAEIDFRGRTWGGPRKGAGRKKLTKKSDPVHRPREEHASWKPVHVVLRTASGVGRLRRRETYAAVRQAVACVARRTDFRVVHLSIQHNHLHLLVEAEHTEALAKGMQAFGTSAAKAINKALARTGKVFAFRYHTSPITSPHQTRNALAYVLNNWRHHREDRNSTAHLDRFSSAVTFRGWKLTYATPSDHDPLPVRPPETWLLRDGWSRFHPLLDPFEVPGHD
jgi:REP element-mobilizing transposase RayT